MDNASIDRDHTTTFPLVLEKEHSESMLVPLMRCARYIRASTVWGNIRYVARRFLRGKGSSSVGRGWYTPTAVRDAERWRNSSDVDTHY